MFTLPNLITIARVLLIPVVAFLLLDHDYKLAFAVFMAAAVGDWLDGFLARRLNQMSQLGAVLDPIADKMTMMIVAILMAAQGLLPIWLAVVIVMRDAIIVAGAIAYRFVVGHIEMAPTRLSKANTFLEFGVLRWSWRRPGNWSAPSPGCCRCSSCFSPRCWFPAPTTFGCGGAKPSATPAEMRPRIIVDNISRL
jgi:cardiolipin synthase